MGPDRPHEPGRTRRKNRIPSEDKAGMPGIPWHLSRNAGYGGGRSSLTRDASPAAGSSSLAKHLLGAADDPPALSMIVLELAPKQPLHHISLPLLKLLQFSP